MNTIDIAALSQIKTTSVKNNRSADVDQPLFSKEMEKFAGHKGTKESGDLKGGSSQTPIESEGTEELTEEEEVDFTLIHPFVRLHQGLDELPVELGITALHNETIEADDTQPVQNSLKVEEKTTHSELTASQILEDSSSLNETLVQVIEEDPVGNISTEKKANLSPNGTQKLDGASDQAGSNSAKLVDIDRKQGEVNDKYTSIDSPTSETNSVEYEVTAASKDHSDLINDRPVASGHKNDSLERMTVQPESSTENREGQTEDLITEPSLKFSVKESDSQSNSIENKPLEQNLSQMSSTDTQVTKTSTEVMAQPSTPVTQEQSLDVISEMLMTVSTETNGEKIYNSTLTLTPETLGEVKIELVYTKDGISGQLVFSSEESKEWMEKQWSQLKLPLETKGIIMNQFEFSVVEPSSVFNQNADTFAQSGQQFNQQSQQQSASASQSSNDSRLVTESNEETEYRTDSESESTGLNLYA